MKKIALLVLLLIFCVFPVSAHALETNPMLRIGVRYGSEALSAANLQNVNGAGYRFGYFDSARNFISVYSTAETKITMVKNTNVYFNGVEPTQTQTDKVVGCFHVETGQTFPDGASAGAYAAQLRANGIPAFVHLTNGVYGVRAGNYTSQAAAAQGAASLGIAGGYSATGSSKCISVIITGTTDIIFQFDNTNGTYLGVFPSQDGSVTPVTWFKGIRYGGAFEYNRSGDSGNITVINTVDIQTYLKGVIAAEMGPSWPVEALKAQALCAKSYAVRNLNKHKSGGFDLCDTVDCQAYSGFNVSGENVNVAVDGTLGIYLTYQGQACHAVYHSSNGGATENSENVWNEAIAYLRAVSDPYEDLQRALYGTWQTTYTNETVGAILRAKGKNIGQVVNMFVESFTPAGNVLSLAVVDSTGKKLVFNKEEARTILNSDTYKLYTRSLRYTIGGQGGNAQLYVQGAEGSPVVKSASTGLYAVTGGGAVSAVNGMLGGMSVMAAEGLTGVPVQASTQQSNGVYVINGRGWGHNVGMSQWGARGMAEQNFTYEQILRHYYTGIELSRVS